MKKGETYKINQIVIRQEPCFKYPLTTNSLKRIIKGIEDSSLNATVEGMKRI